MTIKLTEVWAGNPKGQILELEPPIAMLLIERGAAIEIQAQPQKVQPSEIKSKKR